MRKKKAERGGAKRRREKCTTDYYFDFEEGRGEKGEWRKNEDYDDASGNRGRDD